MFVHVNGSHYSLYSAPLFTIFFFNKHVRKIRLFQLSSAGKGPVIFSSPGGWRDIFVGRSHSFQEQQRGDQSLPTEFKRGAKEN